MIYEKSIISLECTELCQCNSCENGRDCEEGEIGEDNFNEDISSENEEVILVNFCQYMYSSVFGLLSTSLFNMLSFYSELMPKNYGKK